ncbi:MAG: 4Fe-4S binding protein [Deltaproteobacteria bacterium]|jgi:indolepyruvate ferredoxin oxidoreductase, alpha subunit|nr:4Fe-4S binding protein [Deltaproteobacteria bacterium]MBT4637658.1 4Fe-4S binding protein [Deltaproteobacteria bacterium]MBT6498330.1 4Fe-4S binding protein [Deltaproteobacteria bacterium]MBT7152501.1 4Fe-4S binding protein [Deltaproteobacteria bacterium]MBT7711267.1 4Fe-4S binding protein [Deltaproteobacteria bacterium]
MSILTDSHKGDRVLLMGNDAFARGALEAGVNVVSGYPGTPSSEIVENLAKIAAKRRLYVEWSVNEKVALEVAAAASFARLKSMVVMKHVGVNVASDFLLHLSEYGTRGGMVLVSCEDPGALSSTNEGESRPYAKMMEFPLLEPGDFQEAKEMMKWAFELSEAINNIVMVRSVTRLSHASGNVVLGELPETGSAARFEYDGTFFDQMTGPVITVPGITDFLHQRQQGKLKKATNLFETSPFNTYDGPENPELLVITSSACNLYCREALSILALQDRVGLLKLGTTWPLPPRLLEKHLSRAEQILVMEEVQPFMEDNIKALAVELGEKIRLKRFYGKKDGTLPTTNELNPDRVIAALTKILDLDYQGSAQSYQDKADAIMLKGAPTRDLTFCPGCPHRASFWIISSALKMDNRKGFLCGDIGCYTLGILPTGFNTIKTGHAMGSGLGVAGGFGKLGMFGMNQPVMAICGDSTFFHAIIPALINAVHNQSDVILVIVDNSGTAMTGFQPHPGLNRDTFGDPAPQVDISKLCETIGAKVEICDPFDVEKTRQTLLSVMAENKGVRVVVMRQSCALSPEKKAGRMHEMVIDETLCKGDNCGCAKLCTRVFKCPGLNWDEKNQVTRIDEVICTGCGVCASICPAGALQAKPV